MKKIKIIFMGLSPVILMGDNSCALHNSVYNYFARSPARKKAMRAYIKTENDHTKRIAKQRLAASRS